MRTFIYVDGFNLYYGALKGTPWRWLDPVAMIVRTRGKLAAGAVRDLYGKGLGTSFTPSKNAT